MNAANPSLKQLNRTFIGSVLFIDIVGYSKRTVPDQLDMKELFNSLLADAVQNVAPADRIMVDTGDGAAIAFLGDPEDALFAALSLRDAIDSGKANLGEPGFVRMGINLGPLKMVRDINSHTNMIGDGVNDAQRVMSFAEPGQVMVSHSYYDIISRFSRDYAQLFVYEGTRHDKHVREHEVYRFGPIEDNENLTEKLRDRSRARHVGADAPASAPIAGTMRNRGGAFTQAAASAIRNNAVSRVGLISTMIGAVTVVGAVWSWTSAPNPGTGTPTAASAIADQPAPGKAENKSAEKAASAKGPEAAAHKPQPPAEKTAEAKPATDKSKDKPASAAVKPGTLKLAIQPWGEIYIDGSRRGTSPPIKALNLSPGKHRVEIRNSQFAPYKETVDVKSGAEHTVQYMF